MAQERWRKKSGADWARKSFSWFSSIHVIRAITSRAFLSRGFHHVDITGGAWNALVTAGGEQNTQCTKQYDISGLTYDESFGDIMWQQMKPCDNVTLTDLQPVLHIHQTTWGRFCLKANCSIQIIPSPYAHIYHLDHTYAILSLSCVGGVLLTTEYTKLGMWSFLRGRRSSWLSTI